MKNHKENNLMITMALNTACNQTCAYCPPMGESFYCSPGNLNIDIFKKTFKAAISEDVSRFRITGGEPLIYPHFDQICAFLSEYQNLNIMLNTNGVLLKKFMPKLQQAGISRLRISLDTLDSALYHKITGTNLLKQVIQNINLAISLKFEITLIMVVMQANFEHIPEMVAFCVKNKINLKLSDLEENEYTGRLFYSEQYVNGKMIHDQIQSITHSEGSQVKQAHGIEMSDYFYKDTTIRIKNSDSYRSYNSYCKEECEKYPCEEGIFSLMLKPDNSISFCKRDTYNTKQLTEKNLQDIVNKCVSQISTSIRERINTHKAKNIDKKIGLTLLANNEWAYKGNQRDHDRDKFIKNDT